jgi:Domain of unknown function (DUF4832)/Domain of unknown function (DUF4874)
MKRIIILIFTILSCQQFFAQTNITYGVDNSNIQNPERGFCKYLITFPTPFIAITDAELQILKAKKQTIVFRYFYLTDFFNTPISQTYLTQIDDDFKTIRKNGFKVVVRFGYKNDCPNKNAGGNCIPPFLDAPNKTQLLQHIAQLKPFLLSNSDIVMALQNGFWGTYGENFYTDFYGNEQTETITPQHWADRKEILDALLLCVPVTRTVSIRTPQKKAYYYNQAVPQDSITIAQAYNGTNKSRSSAHNDCFLAASDDYTFTDILPQKEFWAKESKYLLMGGETCNDDPIYTNCTNAKNELQRFHWTFCNDGYEPNVLSRWVTGGCFDEIEKKLGYRFVLQNGTYSNAVPSGGNFNYSISLKNEGYAAPVNPRDVSFVFVNTLTAASFEVAVSANPQFWFGGENILLAGNVIIPPTTASGNYAVYLNLSDPTPTLKSKIDYNIRVANNNTWDATTGRNSLLHTLAISGTLPINLISFSGQQVGAENILNWAVGSNSTFKNIEIEYSTDGFIFKKIGDVANTNQANYSFKCVLPNQQNKIFRLKIFDQNGAFQFSNTIKFSDASVEEMVVIKENPIANIVSLKINQTNTLVTIFNEQGKQMFSAKYPKGNFTIGTQNWAKGLYFLQGQSASKQKIKLQFLKL